MLLLLLLLINEQMEPMKRAMQRNANDEHGRNAVDGKLLMK